VKLPPLLTGALVLVLSRPLPSCSPTDPVTADPVPADAGPPADAGAPDTGPFDPAARESFIDGCTGFACANFSVSGEVTPRCEVFKRILYNPPVLGSWLEEWGGARLTLESRGARWTGPDCQDCQVVRAWPRATARWGDPGLPVRLRVDAWAPVVKEDVAATALPVLVARLHLEGPAGEPVALEFDVARAAELGHPRIRASRTVLLERPG